MLLFTTVPPLTRITAPEALTRSGPCSSELSSAVGRLSHAGKRGRKTEQTRSKEQDGVAFSLLGPLEARIDGEALPLGGARQRSLLALLLLHANEPISRERLIEGVWGAKRPSTIGAALNVHLSKIRKVLTAAGNGCDARD